jgi:hypothetical protein
VADIHARVDDALLEAARSATGLPENATGPRIVRAGLATAAGWPAEAVALVARPRGTQETEANNDG